MSREHDGRKDPLDVLKESLYGELRRERPNYHTAKTKFLEIQGEIRSGTGDPREARIAIKSTAESALGITMGGRYRSTDIDLARGFFEGVIGALNGEIEHDGRAVVVPVSIYVERPGSAPTHRSTRKDPPGGRQG